MMVFYSHNKIIYGVKLVINNGTITFDTPSQLIDGTAAYYMANNYLKSELIDTNKWLLVYEYISTSSSTSSRTYGAVVEYTNNIFSVGTATVLTSQNYSGTEIGLCSVGKNKCVVNHRGNNYGYALGVSISGTTISIGTDVQIGYSSAYSTLKTCSIGTDSFGAFYISSFYVYGYYCSLNNLTIILSSICQLTDNAIASSNIRAIKANDNHIFVSVFTTTEEEYGVICTISNNALSYLRSTFKTLGMLHSSTNFEKSASLNLLETNVVLFSANGAKNLSGLRLCKCTITNDDFTIFKKAALSNSKIDGVTVEELTDSVSGDVYILN